MCGSSERKFGVVNERCQQQSDQKNESSDRPIDLTVKIATRSSEVFFVRVLKSVRGLDPSNKDDLLVQHRRMHLAYHAMVWLPFLCRGDRFQCQR